MPLDWSQCPAVESIPGKVSGAWVFKGTRMPVQSVFENLEAGMSIDEIVEVFDVTAEEVLVNADLAMYDAKELGRNRAELHSSVGHEQPWDIGEFYGQSYFCDPRGQFLATGSRDQTELVTAELDLDKIREVRNVWQFYRDRRPETYGGLVEL